MPIVITKSMSKFLKANDGIKDFIMSPLAKRTRLSKSNSKKVRSRKQRKENGDPRVTLNILSKPTDGCINGKNRSRFPDPCQDRSILLALFDGDQNFIRLNYLTGDGELHPDEGTEKEGSSLATSSQYFILLEKIERKYVEDNRTEVFTYPSNGHLENFMYANLQDHTVVDKCLPDGVAGYWIRSFGEPSLFVLTIALWKWSGSSRSTKGGPNCCSDCLQRVSDVKVEFVNVARTDRKSKGTAIVKERKPALDTAELLKDSANNGIIKTLRTFRDNGMIKEFEFACKSFLRTSEEHRNIDSCVIVMLEQSLFYSQQCNPSQAKKVLQTAVELSNKAKFSGFLLNRAYLYLATVHINDGTTGTAEECMTMVKKDPELGIPYEDIGWYYVLKGIIYMKFGEKIERFAEKLWVEAKTMFLEALNQYSKDEKCRVYVVEAHMNLAKLYLVIFHAEMSREVGSTTFFQSADELISYATEHLSFIQILEHSEYSERLQIRYNLLQAECFLASSIRDDAAIAVEEGYWSSDQVDRLRPGPFSDMNHDDEGMDLDQPDVTKSCEESSMLQVQDIDCEIEEGPSSRKSSLSNMEYFGLIIESRRSSPNPVHEEDRLSVSDEQIRRASSDSKLLSVGMHDKGDQGFHLVKKSTDSYFQGARECLHRAEELLHNSLFYLEKKEFERVSLLFDKLKKPEHLRKKAECLSTKRVPHQTSDSGYEADCSCVDSSQVKDVYKQTTYV